MSPRHLHASVTLIGFFLAYFGAMGGMVGSNMPLLQAYWPTIWPMILAVGLIGVTCIIVSRLIDGRRGRS
jgi:hypothetical protein